MRRCFLVLATLLCAGLLFLGLGEVGCSSGQSSGPSSTASVVAATTSTNGAAATGTSAAALALPVRTPIEIYRFAGQSTLWQAWIRDDYVLWMESAGTSHDGRMYSASPDWDIVFRFVDLKSIGGTPPAKDAANEVPGARLLAPRIPDSQPYGLRLPLAWATVLSGTDGQPVKLVWSSPPQELGEDYLYCGLSSWAPGAKNSVDLLPSSTTSITGLASGDAVAIPVPTASFSPTASDPSDSYYWRQLLMLTVNMVAPVAVDPRAPRLTASALAGLSPYFALSGLDNFGNQVSHIFDLRTGEKLPLQLPGSVPQIAGQRAAWYTDNGDVYLTDLGVGTVQKVLSLGADPAETPSFSLGEDWLVALRPAPLPEGTTSSTQPSQHAGADLVALHLPDLTEVDIPSVVAQGELGGVQVSGDVVLLEVGPAIQPPYNVPPWSALRVIRLRN